MTTQRQHPDELERLIAEVQAAEAAGVFKRTPVDVGELVEAESPRRSHVLVHRLFVGLQVAACVALVVGAGLLWRGTTSSQSAVTLAPSNDDSVIALAGSDHMGRLFDCLSGPEDGLLPSECSAVDLDGDADVDLADFGALQRSWSDQR